MSFSAKKRKWGGEHNPWAQSIQKPTLEARDAAAQLRKLLLERFVRGRMVAQDVTLIAWFFSRCGCTGLEDLAVDPDSESSWARVVQDVLKHEFPEPPTYKAEIPVYDKIGCSRSTLKVPFRLPTHIVQDIVQGEESAARDCPDPSEELFGEAYKQHPVVKRAQLENVPWQMIRPLGLYTDAVPYTQNESFIGFSIHDLRSGVKMLSCSMRPALSL